MAAYTLSTLEADIRSYTEVDSNVLTGAILGRFIGNAESRILYDLPMDSDRKSATGNFAVDDNTINNPAGALFIRAVEVFDGYVGEGERFRKQCRKRCSFRGRKGNVGFRFIPQIYAKYPPSRCENSKRSRKCFDVIRSVETHGKSICF